MKIVAIVAAAGGALIIAGCGGSHVPKVAPAPSTFFLTGEISVSPSASSLLRNDVSVGSSCTSSPDGYSDVHKGSQVVITDEGGKTVALGSLEAGLLKGKAGQPLFTAMCSFAFGISGVPTGDPFYGVEVAHRGVQQYSAAQMRDYLHLVLQ